MTGSADPRGSWTFRRRVALARRARRASRRPGRPLWPSLALLGAFLIVSLFGLWALLPGWLHGLGLLAFLAGLACLDAVARARAWRWPDHTRRAAPAGAGQRAAAPAAALARRPALGRRRRPATRLLWRAPPGAAGAGAAQAAGRAAALRPAAARSLGAARGAAAAAAGGAGRGGRHGAGAAGAGVRAAARATAAAAYRSRLTVWVTPPTLHRPAAGAARGQRPTAARRGAVQEPPTGRACPPAARRWPSCTTSGPPRSASRSASTRQTEPFAAIGEDSAEASLDHRALGRSCVIGSAGETLGSWRSRRSPTRPPTIAFAEPPAATHRGVLRSQFQASDDYGVDQHRACCSTGRAKARSRSGIELMRPAGGTTEMDDSAYLDLTPHPWAGLPVVVRLEAVDGIDQHGLSEPQELVLPARPFQHPVARAIIEQRRHLAAEPEQREEVVAALDQLSRAPALFQNDNAVYLALRSAAVRLSVRSTSRRRWTTSWRCCGTPRCTSRTAAVARRARAARAPGGAPGALAEGASDEELERLMAELQRALNEYLDAPAWSRRSRWRIEQQQTPIDPNAIQVERQDLQQMLDTIREMIKTGAREAAQQMLAQLQELLENLQVAQNGQMQQGEQMMSQLQQMIQRQQDLLDQTFEMSRQRDQQGQQGQQASRASRASRGSSRARWARHAAGAAAGPVGQGQCSRGSSRAASSARWRPTRRRCAGRSAS